MTPGNACRARRYGIRDDVVPGLFLRVFPSGARSFALDRMTRGRRRYATIGSADTLAVPEARREARKLIAAFLDTAKKDGGPRTPGRPMHAFAAEFLERQARHWKPRTLETNTYMVYRYILPAFGSMTVDAIAVEHVRDWFPIRVIQVDGGSEFKADFEAECARRGIEFFELPPRSLQFNGHVERNNGAWRYEFYATWELPIDNFEGINRWIGAFADEFNIFRPRQAPRRTNPGRYLAQHTAQETQPSHRS